MMACGGEHTVVVTEDGEVRAFGKGNEVQQSTPMYADCGACGAREADLKCPCKTRHYCNATCQRADFKTHTGQCTHWLVKDIGRQRDELQVMTAQGSSSVFEVAFREGRLAKQHKLVGELLRETVHVGHFPAAEQHLKQAIELCRSLSTIKKQGGLGADTGIQVDNSIATLCSLGSLYRYWQKFGDSVQAFQEAHDSLCDNMHAHGSTPDRQETLAVLLSSQGETYNEQYACERGPDMSKCFIARELVEEAVAINHALNSQAVELPIDLAAEPQHPLNQANRQRISAYTLLVLSCTYGDLEMFEEARRTVKEAMGLSMSQYGNQSEKVAHCHNRMIGVCTLQAASIKKNMRQTTSRYSRGSRVLVEGLQGKPEYNGLEGAVVSSKIAGDLRICVRLDQGSKELRLKPENVRPLVATCEQRQEQYRQLQGLVDEVIAHSKEHLRIQVHVAGVKHFNTGLAYHNLGLVYLNTYKPAETREAVAMLTKAVRILRRFVHDDDPRLLTYLALLKQAHASLAQFEEPGVLSAMPCWWKPTSRQEDEAAMAGVFAALHRTTGSSSRNVSSEAMEEGLRMRGLFNFTASSSDPVSGRDTVCVTAAHCCIS